MLQEKELLAIQVQQDQPDKGPQVQADPLGLPGLQVLLVFLEQQSTPVLLEPLEPQAPLDLQVPQENKVLLALAGDHLAQRAKQEQLVQEQLDLLALQAIPAL